MVNKLYLRIYPHTSTPRYQEISLPMIPDSTDDLTNPKTFRTTMTVQSNLVAHNKIDKMDLIRFLRGADLLNYVKSLHVNFNHTRGLITFTTTPAMEHFLTLECSIRGASVQWTPLTNPYTMVSLMTVPTEIPDELPTRILSSKYGKVVDSFRRKEKLLGFEFETLTRVYKMELKNHIPMNIKICGYSTRVVYTGQPSAPTKCTKCGALGHTRVDCTRTCTDCGSRFHQEGSIQCHKQSNTFTHIPNPTATKADDSTVKNISTHTPNAEDVVNDSQQLDLKESPISPAPPHVSDTQDPDADTIT